MNTVVQRAAGGSCPDDIVRRASHRDQLLPLSSDPRITENGFVLDAARLIFFNGNIGSPFIQAQPLLDGASSNDHQADNQANNNPLHLQSHSKNPTTTILEFKPLMK
jgi:hypothetical protein